MAPQSPQGLTKFSSEAGTYTCPPTPGPQSHGRGSQGGQHCAQPWAAGFTLRLWVELCKEWGSALKVPSGCDKFRGSVGTCKGLVPSLAALREPLLAWDGQCLCFDTGFRPVGPISAWEEKLSVGGGLTLSGRPEPGRGSSLNPAVSSSPKRRGLSCPQPCWSRQPTLRPLPWPAGVPAPSAQGGLGDHVTRQGLAAAQDQLPGELFTGPAQAGCAQSAERPQGTQEAGGRLSRGDPPPSAPKRILSRC